MMARRAPKPITEASLHNAALHYLERFAASTEMVRRVLRRRVERAARAGVAEREPALALVERVLARLAGAAVLDDGAFAAARVETLQRRGGSTRAIRARLAAQGLAGWPRAAPTWRTERRTPTSRRPCAWRAGAGSARSAAASARPTGCVIWACWRAPGSPPTSPAR